MELLKKSISVLFGRVRKKCQNDLSYDFNLLMHHCGIFMRLTFFRFALTNLIFQLVLLKSLIWLIHWFFKQKERNWITDGSSAEILIHYSNEHRPLSEALSLRFFFAKNCWKRFSLHALSPFSLNRRTPKLHTFLCCVMHLCSLFACINHKTVKYQKESFGSTTIYDRTERRKIFLFERTQKNTMDTSMNGEKKEVKYVGELNSSCIESTAHIYCNKTYTD